MGDGLSAAVRANLIALQRLASDIGRVQNRLATGKQVDSPSEGPAAYFTASALNARAAALNSVLDGIGDGKKVIEAANAGIEGIQSLIKHARSLADQALNSASTLAEVTGTINGLNGATVDLIGQWRHHYGERRHHDRDLHPCRWPGRAGFHRHGEHHRRTSSRGAPHLRRTHRSSKPWASTTSPSPARPQSSELSAIGLSAGTTTSSTNSLRQSLAQQFDSVRTQINQIGEPTPASTARTCSRATPSRSC